jgi:hypothetical protein
MLLRNRQRALRLASLDTKGILAYPVSGHFGKGFDHDLANWRIAELAGWRRAHLPLRALFAIAPQARQRSSSSRGLPD